MLGRTVIPQNRFPEKLGDPGQISYTVVELFSQRMNECLEPWPISGASINLNASLLAIWKELSPPPKL
ncbi:hypothetical protein Tco_0518189 [Tanacetum coccineum]